MNRLKEIYQEHPEPAHFARAYLEYVSDVLRGLDSDSIGRFIEVITDARERSAQIIFIGNGGSAATSSHFANDVGMGPRSWEKPFRAISLTDNMPVITALANDHGYDHIFTLQLKTVMRPGDVVVAISASGNSPNVVQAIEYAKANGAITVALTGFDGGKLRELADLTVHVPTRKGEYGPVEDAHMVLDHLVGAFLIEYVRAGETVS